MRRSFTKEFKQGLEKNILLPGGPSASELSKELGIGCPTIRQLIEKDGRAAIMSKSENWSPEKKLQAVNETSKLSEEELGAYLRQNGLLSEDLKV
jgi:transposase-like protein